MPSQEKPRPVALSDGSDTAQDAAGRILDLDLDRPLRTRGTRKGRRVPFVKFLAYYVVLVTVVIGVATFVPIVRRALVAPIVVPGTASPLDAPTIGLEAPPAAVPAGTDATTSIRSIADRSAITAMVMLGSILLAMPVAWVYMFTRRLRYDPSLVQSILILPLVVAGIVLIVKNSLALAFSLAGIVAAVRFRNTLKDPRDAVFIFLVLGLGLATGVQALDVGLVLSFSFNVLVLLLWKTSMDEIYGAARAPSVLGVGDPSVFLATEAAGRSRLRRRLGSEGEDVGADGILLIHSVDSEAAARGAELSLTDYASAWRHVGTESVPFAPGVSTLVLLTKFKKKKGPVELLGELEDRWSAVILAAEYIPFQATPDED